MRACTDIGSAKCMAGIFNQMNMECFSDPGESRHVANAAVEMNRKRDPRRQSGRYTSQSVLQSLRREQAGVRILEITLYDRSIEILKERDIWSQIIEMEDSVAKEQLKELLQGVLDPEAHLVPSIAAKLASTEFEVLFLSGVGEVFPYIRSHNVLNNLQSTAKEKPTVVFFPGAYTHSLESGASLDLFGKLHDDKYYRAFNIFHCEA